MLKLMPKIQYSKSVFSKMTTKRSKNDRLEIKKSVTKWNDIFLSRLFVKILQEYK